MKLSHADLIYKHLTKRSITPLEALRLYGCFRLSGRIYDLKQRGFSIKSRMVTVNGKRVARYSLA